MKKVELQEKLNSKQPKMTNYILKKKPVCEENNPSGMEQMNEEDEEDELKELKQVNEETEARNDVNKMKKDSEEETRIEETSVENHRQKVKPQGLILTNMYEETKPSAGELKPSLHLIEKKPVEAMKKNSVREMFSRNQQTEKPPPPVKFKQSVPDSTLPRGRLPGKKSTGQKDIEGRAEGNNFM